MRFRCCTGPRLFGAGYGAEAAARLYGIIATARVNEIDPMLYPRLVLRNMERYKEEDMPWDNNSLPSLEIRDYAATTDIPWGLEYPSSLPTVVFTRDGCVDRLPQIYRRALFFSSLVTLIFRELVKCFPFPSNEKLSDSCWWRAP